MVLSNGNFWPDNHRTVAAHFQRMLLLLVIHCFWLLLFATTKCLATNLSEFSEPQVWAFIQNAPRGSLDAECATSLNRVEAYLTNAGTLEQQRYFFTEAFSTGDAQQFISRDQDRWLFNAFKCIKAAGESSYSASEYPMHYCYGHSHQNGTTGTREEGMEWGMDEPGTAYGMCIPSTCSGQQDRFQLLQQWQQVASNGTDKTALEFGDCTKSRHAKQWWEQPIPLVHFGSDLVLIALVGFATVLHWRRGELLNGHNKPRLSLQLLLCFSAKRNVQKLVQMPKERLSTITCFFGLRFGAMVWTLVGHSFIFIQAFLANVDEFKTDLVDNFWNQWITNFTLSVDVFLVLSGTLTAYSWFRRWQQPGPLTEPQPCWTSWAYWLRFYRHRVVRLWPAYIYTLVAVTTRVSITHYHPMWPPTDPAVQCPKHWWENVLFINSLTDNRCMPWTWYIGTEFLFYLLSPIFLLSLRQSPMAGILLCTGVSTLSALLNAVTMLRYNFPPTQMLWKQPAIFSPDFILHHLVIYIKPWYRIGPYLVGIVLGYLLAMHSLSPQQKHGASRSRRFVWTGWAMASIGGFWSLYGLYPALQGWNWPLYHLLYGALSRTVFALALGWLIYACHTGIGGPLNWVLSLGPLLPLSNLSYTAYLFHMIPVVFTYIVSPFPMLFESKLVILQYCLIQLAISYCYAILCTLLAELPALNIERILLGRSAASKLERRMLNGGNRSASATGNGGCLCAAEEQLTAANAMGPEEILVSHGVTANGNGDTKGSKKRKSETEAFQG